MYLFDFRTKSAKNDKSYKVNFALSLSFFVTMFCGRSCGFKLSTNKEKRHRHGCIDLFC